MARPLNMNKTATVTETFAAQMTYSIKLLINDGSVDLYFNFDKSVDIAGEDFYKLAPGESMENWEVQFYKIYYKTLTGTAAFRLYGAGLA